MNTTFTLFLYFFIYSVLGWMVETLYCRIRGGKWTNRGFLFGPYCPIYGIGSLMVIYFLNIFKETPLYVFIFGLIFTSTLEYLTSYLLEKAFNAKWWDYSQMKFNINGRVCLLNSCEFATLGVALTYIVHPAISSFMNSIPIELIQLISISLFSIMLIDTVSTIVSLLNLKEKLDMLKEFADKIKEENPLHSKITNLYIYKELSDIRNKFIAHRNIQIERLLEAFPNLEFKGLKDQMNEFKLDLHKLKNKNKNKNKKNSN